MATPGSGQVLDQYLHRNFEVIKQVHEQLPAILRVASHLTPVEDLVDFQASIEAIYVKLGLLVEASEKIVQATDFGMDLIRSVDAAAARLMMGLKSAGLHDAEYFATQANFTALAGDLEDLTTRVDALVVSFAQCVTQDQLTEVINPLAERLNTLEGGGTGGIGGVNTRIDQLLEDLLNGAYRGQLEGAIQLIQGRLDDAEGGIQVWAQINSNLAVELSTLDGKQTAAAAAHEALKVRVSDTEAGLVAQSEKVVELKSVIEDTDSGLAATAGALQQLTTRVADTENELVSESQARSALESRIVDAEAGIDAGATATQQLTTRVQQTEQGITATSALVDQLASRVSDAESGLTGAATAIDELTTSVEQTNEALTIQSEKVTTLTAGITSAGNILLNAGIDPDITGWEFFSKGLGWLTGVLGRDLDGMQPPETHALSLTIDNVPPGAAGIRSARVPVEPGERYMVSGYLAAVNCTARLEWRLLDVAGEILGYGVIGISTAAPPESLSLRDWVRYSGEVPANLGAATLRLEWWVDDCHAGNPKAWLLRPMAEQMVPGQINPSPWTAGAGAVGAFGQAISELGTRVTQTEDALEVTSTQLTDLTARVDLTDSNVAGLTGRVDAQGEALATLDTRVEATEAGIASVSNASTNLSSQLNLALETANQAKAQADAARYSANQLGGKLADIAADIVLTPNEKPPLILEWESINAEIAGLRAQATAAGLTTELATLNTAFTDLSNYLSTLTSPVSWNNTTGNTLLI